MAIKTIDDTNLTNIANAIRSKLGVQTTYKPSEMAQAINDIIAETSVTKGIVVNSWDKDGYATDVSLVGMTEIPNYYFQYSAHSSGGWLSKIGSNLHLPDNLTSIGSYAFYYCSNLALTSLPSGITSIGSRAFYYCENLALTSLPSGVISIPANCFYRCMSLTEMTLNGDIESIGSYAFRHCNLTKLVMPNVTSVPTLSSTAFSNTTIESGTGYIYVPDTLVDSFKSETNWSAYANQIKGISEL